MSWFETNVIHDVTPNYPGAGRKVYPGFLQHAGFVAMNPSRHFQSHWDFYQSLLRGDEDDAEADQSGGEQTSGLSTRRRGRDEPDGRSVEGLAHRVMRFACRAARQYVDTTIGGYSPSLMT